MPIIKSAIKKMRKDKIRTAHNLKIKINLKGLIKNMRKNPSAKVLQEVTSVLDKATKTNLIHPNKASRLKSRLFKLLSQESKTAKTMQTNKTPTKSVKPAKK